MHVAALLSDLTTLGLAPGPAAIALVSARPSPDPAHVTATPSDAGADPDPAVARASQLLALHALYADRGGGGVDAELVAARRAVGRAVAGLGLGGVGGAVGDEGDGAAEEERDGFWEQDAYEDAEERGEVEEEAEGEEGRGEVDAGSSNDLVVEGEPTEEDDEFDAWA